MSNRTAIVLYVSFIILVFYASLGGGEELFRILQSMDINTSRGIDAY